MLQFTAWITTMFIGRLKTAGLVGYPRGYSDYLTFAAASHYCEKEIPHWRLFA